MKIQFLFKSFAIAFIALFTFTSLSAQNTPPSKPKTSNKDQADVKPMPPHKEGTEVNDTWEDEQYVKELKLTPEQKTQFKKANDEYKAKSKAMKTENKEEAKRLRDERRRAHKAALTPEQAKKYDEINAKKDAKRHEKHGQKKQKKEVKKAKKEVKKEQKSENKEIKKELEKQ